MFILKELVNAISVCMNLQVVKNLQVCLLRLQNMTRSLYNLVRFLQDDCSEISGLFIMVLGSHVSCD